MCHSLCFLQLYQPLARATWMAFPEVNPVFHGLSTEPVGISDEQMLVLGRLVILLLDNTRNKEMISLWIGSQSKQTENLSSTRNSFLQHLKCAAVQAGDVWF